uniref:Cytochrome P450 4V2 (inferred by orthology to a human protein) n=1 Tax=Nippostrongylus brasiliensis TaxID=27835 RepID=A0A0N4Y7G0_NIPBR
LVLFDFSNRKIDTSLRKDVIERLRYEDANGAEWGGQPSRNAISTYAIKLGTLENIAAAEDEWGLRSFTNTSKKQQFLSNKKDEDQSHGMGWTLWFMAVHPEYQVKVQQELDEIFDSSSDRSCTSEDLSKMKYLEKCIKESLRVRPPVPMMTRKVEQDIEIGNTTIPRGCSIMISAGVIHTNPTVYENPYRFDPERFSDDVVQQRHPYAFIPFSAGPRNCIGQKFAMFVEKTVLSWFFRRFSISTLIPPENNVALPEIILKPSLGFPCIISSR